MLNLEIYFHVFDEFNLYVMIDIQGVSEKMAKQMESQISEMNSRVEESQRTIVEINSQKTRLQSEVADLNRQLEDTEHNLGTLTKDKSSLNSQLEEARRSLEDETRVSLLHIYFSVNVNIRL